MNSISSMDVYLFLGVGKMVKGFGFATFNSLEFEGFRIAALGLPVARLAAV